MALFLSLVVSYASVTVSGATTVGGRIVIAESRGLYSGVSFFDQFGTSSIECGRYHVQVTADTIQVTGHQPTTIPAACKKIKLVSAGGTLHVYFDGVENH